MRCFKIYYTLGDTKNMSQAINKELCSESFSNQYTHYIKFSNFK